MLLIDVDTHGNKTREYHLLAIVKSFEFSRDVISRFVRFARRLAARINKICIHNVVVCRPKVVSVASSTRSSVRSRGADGSLRFPRTTPQLFLAIALFLKTIKIV
jgi:hypothetical protein